MSISFRPALAALTLTAAIALAAPATAKIETGASVADMTVTDSNGTTHNLSDFAGQKVVLEWTNDQCPYVKKHYNTDYDGGNMQNLQADATADGVVWLTVNSSAPGKQGHVNGEEANQLTAERGAAPTAVILDPSGEMGMTFSAKTTPHMYVIDESQTLVYQGAIDDNRSSNPDTIAGATNYVTAALTSLETGSAVEVGETTPYGCTVKY